MQLTGILRETAFSPFQHAQNDRLILELTARLLERGAPSAAVGALVDRLRPATYGAAIERAEAWAERLKKGALEGTDEVEGSAA